MPKARDTRGPNVGGIGTKAELPTPRIGVQGQEVQAASGNGLTTLLRATRSSRKTAVTINGERNLGLSDVLSVARLRAKVRFAPSAKVLDRTTRTLAALKSQIASGVPIYGVSSAFGGQAGRILNQGSPEILQKNACALSAAIVHVDVSTGDPLPVELVRAAMLIRLNMLAAGYSGIRPSTLLLIATLLNAEVTPVVGRYGSVGASGDLAQNGRLISVLQHHASARVYDSAGIVRPAAEVLQALQMAPLVLEPKEGLALVNGDNYSSAAALATFAVVVHSLLLQLHISAIVVQVLLGSDRNFHPLLDAVRPHPGQSAVAQILRNLLSGSHMAPQEIASGHRSKAPGVSVQDAYSIRCLPQFLGPDVERLESIRSTIAININSVSDNPLWTDAATAAAGELPEQWVSGGNFLAMHMAEALDAMRKTMVRLVKLNDRHVARMVHSTLNNGLPPNLSPKDSISRCVFKGLQTQMGMFDVYATTLAAPVTTNFGTHEELNQDITSHALTSYLIGIELTKVLGLAQASTLLAACQAVDLRGGPAELSESTRPLYEWVRSRSPFVRFEQPLGADIELVASELNVAPLSIEECSEDTYMSGVFKSAR